MDRDENEAWGGSRPVEPTRSSGKRMTMWRHGEGPWRDWCHGERAERGNQDKGGNLSMERSQRYPLRSLSSPWRDGDDLSMERLSPALGQAGWGQSRGLDSRWSEKRVRKEVRQKNGATRGSARDV